MPQVVCATSEYSGNLIYRDGKPHMLLFDGGYVSFAAGREPQYVFYLRDHLGSNRMAVTAGGTIVEQNHYYPYGSLMDNSDLDGVQPFKYSGKELDRMLGLDLIDYGARWYDPVVPHWMTVDAECEDTPEASPYVFNNGNPVNNIDTDGNSTKPLRILYRFGKAVYKNGLSSLGKAATYTSAVKDITDDVKTVFDSDASVMDRFISAASLASEILSPVSVNDVKDVVKVAKGAVGKVVQKATKATAEKAVHGNSKLSTKAQHAYDIIEIETGRRVKTGVSGGKVTKNGKSYRAESQVRKLNKKEGYEKYKSEIVHWEPAGEGARDRILEYEKERANALRKELDKNIGAPAKTCV